MRPLAPLVLLLPALAVAQATAATPPSAAPAASAAAAAQASAAPLPQATLDKIAEGDRSYVAGDFRQALFAYQDATYLSPRSAAARVRLGRAYLALRYPDRAVESAQQALADDPESTDAKTLLEESRTQAATGGGVATPLTAMPATPAPAKPGPKTYKLTPPPDEAKPPSGPRALAASTAIVATPAPAAAAPDPAAAAQHYRTAIGLLQNRDWSGAVHELSQAIHDDPNLAVAYSARGSAHFGLGKYAEAAEDYQKASALDPNLGTPVYGLAECYRMLGDKQKAAAAYEKYARSTASDVREDLRAAATKRAAELK
jgi:tetratricopeptide (TPR) repeat protein